MIKLILVIVVLVVIALSLRYLGIIFAQVMEVLHQVETFLGGDVG